MTFSNLSTETYTFQVSAIVLVHKDYWNTSKNRMGKNRTSNRSDETENFIVVAYYNFEDVDASKMK